MAGQRKVMNAKGGEQHAVNLDSLSAGKAHLISDTFNRNLGIGLSMATTVRRALDLYLEYVQCLDAENFMSEFEQTCWCAGRNPRDLLRLDGKPKQVSRKPRSEASKPKSNQKEESSNDRQERNQSPAVGAS